MGVGGVLPQRHPLGILQSTTTPISPKNNIATHSSTTHEISGLAQGEENAGIRIEVPPPGGAISGRVVDRDIGAPLAGIFVDAGRVGVASHTEKTDSEGRYTILGLSEGEWRVRPDRGNPIFVSSFVHDMEMVSVRKAETTRLDLTVERSTPVRGQVVDANNRPVPDAWVDTTLFLIDGNGRMSCYFKTDTHGRFTVWGRTGSERMTLSARKKDILKSSMEVVDMTAGENVENVLLTLYPAAKVSGRFVDENGIPVKAMFWRRAIHPDGNGQWNGISGKPRDSFDVSLARGSYEIKGRAKGNNFGIEELMQTIHVGSDDISNLVVTIRTAGAITGPYTVRGIVVDENGKPLTRTRVYVAGTTRENIRSSQSTRTDTQGRFSFAGLMDAGYRVHATPDEPFEQFAGFDSLNPAETSDIKIVVRRSGRVRGWVVDAATGEPITNFRAEYGGRDTANPLYRENRWDHKKITSELGIFDLPMRLEKEWYVRISADGYAEAFHTGSALSSGQVVPDLEFRLLPGRVVRGTVTNGSGEPVVGALVYHNEDVFDFMRRRKQYAAAVTDDRGAFTLASLPEGIRTIYAHKPGFAVAQYTVADEMKIVLTQGGVIEGHVVIGGAVPIRKTSIVAMDLDNPQLNYWGHADGNGYFRITELMDRPYKLSVTFQDETSSQAEHFGIEDPVEAADGMVTTFDIAIPLGSAILEGVISKDGTPVPNYHFFCGYGGYLTQGRTDETGYYRFENLPPGPVKVVMLVGNPENLLKPSFKTIGELNIEAGTEVHQDFELPDL